MPTVCKKCAGCRGVLKRRDDLFWHVVGRKDEEGIIEEIVKKKKWSGSDCGKAVDEDWVLFGK